MPRFRVRLLGGFEVTVDDRVVSDFESGTARALLARLAAEPQHRLSRSMLAEFLWPDRPEGAAAANLRHCLSAVRRAIGDTDPGRRILDASRTDVALCNEADISVDLAEFESLASTALSEPGAVASWEAAVRLRSGPFLDGFDAQLSETWDTWLSTTRNAVDQITISTLRRLAELRERTGERRLAIGYVRRWVELDPWNEHAHRMLIRLLACEDERAAALVEAEEFATTLGAELGIEPSATTRALVDEIRSGRFPLQVPDAPQLPPRLTDGILDDPCVGRAVEQRWLRAQLDAAQAGSGRVVFVVGQPGSGKTLLLRAFERDVVDAMPNVVVVRGACSTLGGAGDPFQPFRHVLSQLLGDIELDWTKGLLTPSEAADRWHSTPRAIEVLLDHGPDLLGPIVDPDRLLARFERGFPDHPLMPRLRSASVAARRRVGDSTRRRQPLVERCTRVLTALARLRPLVITIDDLQWADPGTLDVVSHLATSADGVPLLVVATLRPGELERSHADPVQATVNELAGHAREPCRLELTGSRTFVDAWLDTEPNVFDETFRDRLHRTTGGNALFTVETVRALQATAHIVRDPSGRWRTRQDGGWDELPPRVDATIAARLAELPEELRRDLDVASVQGDEFAAEVVARVRDAPVLDVVLRLSSLCATPSSLLRPGGSETVGGIRLDRFSFRHSLFRQHLYDHLTPAVRCRAHERTGRALEEIYDGDLERIAGDLAAHFDAAGLIDDAVAHHTVAGRRAALITGHEDAVRHYERALELLAALEPAHDPDPRQLTLLTSLGACRQWQFGYNAPATTAVYEQLRQLTHRVSPSLESAIAIGGLLSVDGLRANYSEALAGAEQLLDLAGELDAAPIETVARMQLGWMLLMVGRIVEADEQLAMSIERYDPTWDSWLTPLLGSHVPSTSLAWRSNTLWYLGHFEQARRAGHESIERARAAHFPFGLAFTLLVGGSLLAVLFEEPDAIAAHATEAATIAREEDFAFYEAGADIYLGCAKVYSADPLSGVAQMRAGLRGWETLGTDAFGTSIRTWLAEAFVRGGELRAAGDELAAVDRRLADGEEHLAELRRSYVGAMLRCAEGDIGAAAAELRCLIETARSARAHGHQLQAEAALAALTSGNGDRRTRSVTNGGRSRVWYPWS